VIRQRDVPETDKTVDPSWRSQQAVRGEFNNYLGSMNRLNKGRHRAAAIGYILAGSSA